MRRGELNPGCVPPNLKQGTPSSMCTHEITAHFTVADMAQKCDIRKNPGCWGQDYDKNHQVIPNKIFSFNFVLNPRESIWSMLRDTVTLRRASAWSFTMQTLASFCVLTIQHMEKPTRSSTACFACFAIGTIAQVFDELGYLAIPPCIWGTEEVFHWKSSMTPEILDPGGTDRSCVLAVQRQPDLDQAEQQHIHPLWRDGLLADERDSCWLANWCLKHELSDELWSV